MDCPFCPRRIDDDPLKELDSSARNEGKKKNLKKGQSHVKAAANCEVGAIFKQLAPACSICGKGDATTAAAVREDGVPQEELKCRLCRSKRGAAAALASLAARRSVEDKKRAETDLVHIGRRSAAHLSGQEEDWHAVDAKTGLSKYDELVDATDALAAEDAPPTP